LILIKNFGPTPAGQNMNRKHFLHAVCEFYEPTVCALRVSMTRMPQDRSFIGTSPLLIPLNTALSRTCDNPTNAYGPTKSSPRANPGRRKISR
jgi:hypothetical protein